MNIWQKGKSSSQRGAVLVFAALVLPMLVFLGGMALDFGRAYIYESAIQNAADSAALAGVAAAANSDGKARLISKEDMPVPIDVADKDTATLATTVATHVLAKDVGEDQSPATKLFVKKKAGAEDKPEAYYYQVEMSGNVALVFARYFLPDSLMPEGFSVKVRAIAMAKVGQTYGTMMEQLDKLKDEEFFNDFYDVEDIFKKQGYDAKTARIKAKEATFTNKGIRYHEDGTRSEVFNMDSNSSVNTDAKSVFINTKGDVIAKGGKENAFTYNWDVDDMWNLTAQEARNLFYDENGVATTLFTNWLLYNETASTDPYVNGPHEGATITWDQFVRQYVGSGKPYQTVEDALRVLTSRIESIINVDTTYGVREGLSSRSPDEVYTDADGNVNLRDPLFVRIESEEFNKVKGNYITNSVRKITINVNANNMADGCRPLLFLYEGPEDINHEFGKERKSQILTVNLNEDFKGAIYAPNSPVCINGNGHNFRGVIVAQSIVDSEGHEIPMPEELTESNEDFFQTFYQKLNLGDDTQYDDFGVIKLANYKTPRKDVVFLTERASATM